MINEVILVGRIKEISCINECKRRIELEVDRPFNDKGGIANDSFICELWQSIFSKITNFCKKGDILAIRGRMQSDNNNYLVIAEKVVLLNKSKENILKDK